MPATPASPPRKPSRPKCPDGGTCHHDCPTAGSCFRVLACEPLSGVYPGDKWPKDVIDSLDKELVIADVMTWDVVTFRTDPPRHG